jgi:hypothetical protein
LTSTSDRPTRVRCPVYGALPPRFAVRARGPAEPDRTNVLGARCSTRCGDLGRLRVDGRSAQTCSESRTTFATCQACPVYCRQYAARLGCDGVVI